MKRGVRIRLVGVVVSTLAGLTLAPSSASDALGRPLAGARANDGHQSVLTNASGAYALPEENSGGLFGGLTPARGNVAQGPRVPDLDATARLQPLDAARELVVAASLEPSIASSLRNDGLASLQVSRAILDADQGVPKTTLGLVGIAGAVAGRGFDTAALPDRLVTSEDTVQSLAPLVRDWFSAHGVVTPHTAIRELREIATLPPALRDASLRVLRDYLAVDELARLTYLPFVDEIDGVPATSPTVSLGAAGSYEVAGLDLDALQTSVSNVERPHDDNLLTARQRLAGSLAELELVSTHSTLPLPNISIPPLVSLRWDDSDNTYSSNFGLLVDAGGNDTYLNNAGGSSVVITNISAGECPIAVGAGALLDMGGNDSYASGKSCGVNGGAFLGSGLLIDSGGDDQYIAGSYGTNGSAIVGSALIIDSAGSDRYVGGALTNGSASSLIYARDVPSTVQWASGGIIDGGGNDQYRGETAANATANPYSSAAIIDLAGDDVFNVQRGHGNGTAIAGTALLLDRDGNDSYLSPGALSFTNGATATGVAMVIDAAGNDLYSAAGTIANGSALTGLAALIDLGGDDIRTSAAAGQNGLGMGLALGMLIDASGHDQYRTGHSSNGFGIGLVGSLYPSPIAPFPAAGVLIDGSGDDDYAGTAPSNGNGVNGGGPAGPGFGILIDLNGADTYGDDESSDCSRVLTNGIRSDLTGTCVVLPS